MGDSFLLKNTSIENINEDEEGEMIVGYFEK